MIGYRPMTIHARTQVLRNFARWMQPQGLMDATRADVEAFLARPLAAQSRRAYRGHILGYYAWLVDEGHLTENPAARVPTIRVKRGTPRPIATGDLVRAIDTADPVTHAQLLLMALAGLRACEVARLRPQDIIEGAEPILYLRERKGGHAGSVPAHPLILEALRALPIQPSGLWWSPSSRCVQRRVSDHLRAVGAPGGGHQLRHFAGTTWYRESGHDLLVTALLLGHKSVVSAQIYTELDPSRPAEVVRRVALPSAS